MRIAICDDDKAMHNKTIEYLNEYKMIKHINMHIDSFFKGAELLRSSQNYDIILMDYHIGDMNGIETCRILRQTNTDSIIIFISAFIEASLDSFEVGAFRFLAKPIDKEKFFKALDDYNKSINYSNALILNTHDSVWKIKFSDIIYAEACGRNTVIRTLNQSFDVHLNLKVVENKLPADRFVRCQKAYVVGFMHISNHTSKEIIFDNGEKAQIGKSYYPKFRSAFREHILKYNYQVI